MKLIDYGFTKQGSKYLKGNVMLFPWDDSETMFDVVKNGLGDSPPLHLSQVEDFLIQHEGAKKVFEVVDNESIYYVTTRLEFENLFTIKDRHFKSCFIDDVHVTYYEDGKGMVWMPNHLFEMTNNLEDLITNIVRYSKYGRIITK